MNIKDAFEYAISNHKQLTANGQKVIGIAHRPLHTFNVLILSLGLDEVCTCEDCDHDDSCVTPFYEVEIGYHGVIEHDTDDEDVLEYFRTITWDNDETAFREGLISAIHSPEEAIEEIPLSCRDIQFFVYEINDVHLEQTHILEFLSNAFPELKAMEQTASYTELSLKALSFIHTFNAS
ncbi:hypothetical protein J4N45_10530 [Vibrio sp. SCSIO 43140]|uniref:hypothetical protein n=1 Tax=Vibrio sp. SCSIO 43140 TaxID=2819100 RepID=UPI002074C396|nr:hypothetical protein [Vibrio sp. SCSIO 43140]USD58966.1 hypothetical protein J4N45_10530 [Vibrio sp. SCSIO 43140]